MNISIIGSGNVAWHLGRAMAKAGHRVTAVCSRNLEHANDLARELGCRATSCVEDLSTDDDFHVISVSDDQIESVAQSLPPTNGIVVHTSGATDIGVLGRHRRFGSLYPCQTFTRTDSIDMSQVPYLIEGNSPETTEAISRLAESISEQRPTVATSEQRACVHLAAVFSSNFCNHMLTLADRFLAEKNLDFNILEPLIMQTMKKAFGMKPFDAQTGPARRGDARTIARHLSLIDDEQMRKVYETLTESISTLYNNRKGR